MLNLKKHTLCFVIAILSALSLFSQENDKHALKVMTYNIWNGFDWGKDTLRKAKTIKWIGEQKPDVVALQELCGYTEKKLRDDALKWGHSYVEILKTDGYPTAITSNQPITVKNKIGKPFWHGLLHCETYGIDFYIVHLSPSDSDIRLKEAKKITEFISSGTKENYIVLGDFNSHSPFDAHWLEKKKELKKGLKGNDKYSNLRQGEFDYAVISAFLASPTVDISLNKIAPDKAYTFPTPALIGKYSNTKHTIIRDRERIDYILVSPELATSCVGFNIFNQEETALLSDHYPVMAEFAFDRN